MNGYRFARLAFKWTLRTLAAAYVIGLFSLGIHGCITKSATIEDALWEGAAFIGVMTAFLVVVGGGVWLYDWLETNERNAR